MTPRFHRYCKVAKVDINLIRSARATRGHLAAICGSRCLWSAAESESFTQFSTPQTDAPASGTVWEASLASVNEGQGILTPGAASQPAASGDSSNQWTALAGAPLQLWANHNAEHLVQIGQVSGKLRYSHGLPGGRGRLGEETGTVPGSFQEAARKPAKGLPVPESYPIPVSSLTSSPYPLPWMTTPAQTLSSPSGIHGFNHHILSFSDCSHGRAPWPPLLASRLHTSALSPNPNPNLAQEESASQPWDREDERSGRSGSEAARASSLPQGVARKPTYGERRRGITEGNSGETLGTSREIVSQEEEPREEAGFVVSPPRAPSPYIQPIIDALNALPSPSTTNVEDLQCEMVEALLGWDGRLDVFKVGNILGHITDPRLALLFHRWACRQERYQPSAVLYTILVNLVGRKGEVRLLRGLMKEVLESNLRLTTNFFNRAMRAFGDNGAPEDALRVFREMERAGCMPDTHTLRTLVRLYRDVGAYEAAMDAFEKLKARGLKPSSWTYSILVDLCGKVRKPEVAEELLEEMVAKGLEPNIVTYNSLLKAYLNSGDVDRALSTFWRLEKVGCKPDSITYLSLLSGLRKAFRMEDAREVVQHLEESDVDISTALYTTVMCLFGEQGDLGMAEHMFNSMEDNGHRRDSHSYSVMMSVYGKAGWVEEALHLLDEMVADGIKPDNLTFGILVDMLRHAGQFEEADRLAEQMQRLGGTDRGVIYAVQIQNLLDSQQYRDVPEVVQKMRSEQVATPLRLYASLLAGYTRCANQEGLKFLAAAMGLTGHWVHSMVVLLQKRGVEEEWLWAEGCRPYLDQLQGTAAREGGHRLIDVLIAFLHQLGLQERGVRLWEEARARRLIHPTLALPDMNSEKWEINLAHYEPGSACLILIAELMRLKQLATEGEAFPFTAEIIVGLGNASAYTHEGPRDKVVFMLEDMASPFEVNPNNRGRLQVKGPILRYWLRRRNVARLLIPRNRFWT